MMSKDWIALASVIGLAVAAFGGALGQGRALASALDGMTRNPGSAPKVLAPMIIGLSLIEALVIYCLIMAIMYYAKV